MTFNITTPSITTLSTVDLIETRSINDNQRYVNQTTDIMLHFVMTLLSVVMLCVTVSNKSAPILLVVIFDHLPIL
jgi:hypothetical protein